MHATRIDPLLTRMKQIIIKQWRQWSIGARWIRAIEESGKVVWVFALLNVATDLAAMWGVVLIANGELAVLSVVIFIFNWIVKESKKFRNELRTSSGSKSLSKFTCNWFLDICYSGNRGRRQPNQAMQHAGICNKVFGMRPWRNLCRLGACWPDDRSCCRFCFQCIVHCPMILPSGWRTKEIAMDCRTLW